MERTPAPHGDGVSTREADVRALYRLRPRNHFLRASVALLLLLGVSSFFLAGFDLGKLFSTSTAENLSRFLGRVVPAPLRGQPFDLDVFAGWVAGIMDAKGWHAAGITLAISVAAIALAALLALVLCLPAARTFATPEPYLPAGRGASRVASWAWRAVALSVRALFILMRALPEYVWAFLLLAIFGPTAWPAVLALAIHNAGILGKLYAETLENARPAPLRSLRALGADRRQMMTFAALPDGLGRFLLYFFYRWETCVREATVLGMLGIVSLGYYIMFDARPRWRVDEMVLLIALGSAIVLVGDLVSALARAAIRKG